MRIQRATIFSLLGSVLAARPADVSVCDYYTTALLQKNTPANQYTLITLLVNAVVIGNYTTPNTGVALSGILAPGVYNGVKVDLAPYFNGCLKSTNRGDVAVSVNFLDGGGAEPLKKNLPAYDNKSNQYYLLTHLYQFIGKLVGCTGYGKDGFPAYQGKPSQYQVHKFMALDENQLGYFIQQVGLSALSYGVSEADATAAGAALMATFGYRCSPPAPITDGPQLQSICVAKTCPLDPKAQCNLYPWGGISPPPASVCPAPAPAPAPAPPPKNPWENQPPPPPKKVEPPPPPPPPPKNPWENQPPPPPKKVEPPPPPPPPPKNPWENQPPPPPKKNDWENQPPPPPKKNDWENQPPPPPKKNDWENQPPKKDEPPPKKNDWENQPPKKDEPPPKKNDWENQPPKKDEPPPKKNDWENQPPKKDEPPPKKNDWENQPPKKDETPPPKKDETPPPKKDETPPPKKNDGGYTKPPRRWLRV